MIRLTFCRMEAALVPVVAIKMTVLSWLSAKPTRWRVCTRTPIDLRAALNS